MSRLMHKRGRPSNYLKSLQNDNNWNEVKYQVRCRDGHACLICGKTFGFECHHITYYDQGISIRGRELEHLKWLALVCGSCHSIIHKTPNHPLNPSNPLKINAIEYRHRYTIS